MYVIECNEKHTHPIKVWLRPEEELEAKCLEQAQNLASLPFIHPWIALMPDVHVGKGMPIGGVLPAEGVVIPNAVGVDIGCGMAFLETNVEAAALRQAMTNHGTLLQGIVGEVLRNIPVGKKHYQERQESEVVAEALLNIDLYSFAPELLPEIEAGYYQIGTLGGGNHFIEFQEDEQGLVSIMLHSGSRHLGYKICNYFNNLAKMNRQNWGSTIPDSYFLDYLPVASAEGEAYLQWMELGLAFAKENRAKMMMDVEKILERLMARAGLPAPQYGRYIECHHNYAALEHHFGKDVWVHRKGAVKAGEDQLVIVPGAMGANSYILRGKGNPESFQSCSHGAGRILSRTKAKEVFKMETVIADLKAHGVVLGKNKRSDVTEEARQAYKDIEGVLANELDLAIPFKQLKTLGVIKG